MPGIPFKADTELGPNSFEEHWRGDRDEGQLADPTGGNAAAASFDPGEPDGGEVGVDDSWLSEEERSALDPNDPTYQTLMRAFARKQGAGQQDSGQVDLNAQLEAIRLQQELEQGDQPQQPTGEQSLWEGWTAGGQFPPELQDYESVINARIQSAANHVVDVLQRRAEVQERAQQHEGLKSRLKSEVSALLTGESAAAFREDMSAVMRAANTPTGKTLLADPSVGLRGVWNLVRANSGKGPFVPQQASGRQNGQRIFPGEKRNHAVERTVPSTTRSVPAVSQLPQPRSTREAVEQAFAAAVEEVGSRRR